MRIDFISLFPGFYTQPLSEGIFARAARKQLIEMRAWNLRDFTEDKHRMVDDTPCGGGGGMVLKPEPVFKAVRHITDLNPGERPYVVLPSPQGTPFDQPAAQALSEKPWIVFICPRYQGIDARVSESLVDSEISIGNYVIHSGDTAAWVISEAALRCIPGVVGNPDSVENDSFYQSDEHSGPVFTRPVEYEGMKVPEVLLSGNHQAIHDWRKKQAQKSLIQTQGSAESQAQKKFA